MIGGHSAHGTVGLYLLACTNRHVYFLPAAEKWECANPDTVPVLILKRILLCELYNFTAMYSMRIHFLSKSFITISARWFFISIILAVIQCASSFLRAKYLHPAISYCRYLVG